MTPDLSRVKAIVFDVFGTVVDWRGSIIRELNAVGREFGIDADWESFADRWRGGYLDGPKLFRDGKREWLKADTLHWERLQSLKIEFGLGGLSDAQLVHLNKAWHRLTPWPDAVQGLSRLRDNYRVGTLSNGDNVLLSNMARNAGLPWDIIMGAENFQSYKPDPKVYLGAVELLGCQPHEVMVTAAHLSDLHNAKLNGLRAAFVPRPDEFGPASNKADLVPTDDIDVTARDFLDLASKMGMS